MADLTIAYITSRSDPKIGWFFDSLASQISDDLVLTILVINRNGPSNSVTISTLTKFSGKTKVPVKIQQTRPKPNVWSGPHRLTKEDWFSASSARNTALCLTRTSHIAYCDDLSVLMPGWWQSLREAIEGNYIGCGRYQKVRELVVKDGVPTMYTPYDGGIDNRLALVNQDVTDCNGAWLYGCSLVAPVDALLSVDGWPESLCDGMGFEDCILGIVLVNAGYQLKYDRRMFTLESDELHFVEPPMKRSDYGVSPNDKSHKALSIARNSKTFDNGFGEGGIRALREKVLAGEPFPIQRNPRHEWFLGTPLEDL